MRKTRSGVRLSGYWVLLKMALRAICQHPLPPSQHPLQPMVPPKPGLWVNYKWSPKRVHQAQDIISSHMKLLPLKASSGKTLQNCVPLLLNRTILKLLSFILGHLPTPCSTKDPQVGHVGSHLSEGAGLCLNQTQKLGAHPLQVHSTPPAHLASLPALGTDDMDKGNAGEVGSK